MISYATLLYLSAVFTGIERGGIPGLAPVAMTSLVATSGSAALSRRLIGLLIPVCCASDLYACYAYKESIRWDILRNLVLPVAVGIFFSFLTLGRLDAEDIRAYVGLALAALLLFLFVITVIRGGSKDDILPTSSTAVTPPRSFPKSNVIASDPENDSDAPRKTSFSMTLQDVSRPLMATPVFHAFIGFVAGYLTVVANVAGLVIIVFLMAMNLPLRAFNGTRSAILLICNGCKLPGQMLLGAIQMTTSDFVLILPLILASVLSAYITEKYFVTPKVDQAAFEFMTWLLLAFAATKLVFVF